MLFSKLCISSCNAFVLVLSAMDRSFKFCASCALPILNSWPISLAN
jgi:hypothetical protein